ncbi:hypothetical protein [Microbispora corallina]|uniref:hypothetical protein n=1 Tax=Microbispora corallina TaxID=83302 RepID=UPI0019521FE9|nr:hypothetical protein [Microbispora corallina]
MVFAAFFASGVSAPSRCSFVARIFRSSALLLAALSPSGSSVSVGIFVMPAW